jgi:lipopolysaccharide export LptBFGC system permease protein LptF
MVFTLHRYIFREVFKVFVLATLAMTLIISLGSVLRPIQEYGVGPGQVLQLIGYFMPITLTFVLPMGALFAAALVYGRLASDNELDACRASGVSLLTLVYPGLLLAIMVAVANLILSFHVVPAFVHLAEKSLKANAKQILFRNIQRSGYYKIPDGRYRIYADAADEASGILAGVVVTEIKDLRIERIITANLAKVTFSPHERYNEVQIIAENSHQMGSADEGWFFAESLSLTTEFGSLLSDDIKFKKIRQMKDIRADPMRFGPVERLARETYAQFVAELLARDITRSLAGKPGGSYKLHSGAKVLEFSCDRCEAQDDRKVAISGNIAVAEADITGSGQSRTLSCSKGFIHVEGDELAPTFTMELRNPTWRGPDEVEHLAGTQIVRGLIPPQAVAARANDKDLLRLLKAESVSAALDAPPSRPLAGMLTRLRRQVRSTLLDITAEIHSRLVFGIGCLSVIAVGIAIGIIKKGGHLLGAFGASSLPAAALIVCIMMGKNITKNQNSPSGYGIIIMWSGLAALTLFALAIYRRLLRN